MSGRLLLKPEYSTNPSKTIKLWHSMLNKNNKVGAIVMELSKAFDSLNCITSFYGN